MFKLIISISWPILEDWNETVVDCSFANNRIIADSYRTDALLLARMR